MIHHIEFLDPDGVALPNDVSAGYEFKVPSLRGRTFEFRPGPNVVVGANGSGKTSLLNVIRYITFCNGEYGSALLEGREYGELQAKHSFERGYWHLAKMKAQYGASTFNLRKIGDFNSQDAGASMVNFTQTLRTHEESHGEGVMDALAIMMNIQNKGVSSIENRKGEKEEEPDDKGFFRHHYFRKMVTEPMEKLLENSNDVWKAMWSHMLSYYKENTISGDERFREWFGFTLLMDEPDDGLDVDNLEKLYKLVDSCPSNYQMIAVVHNVALIERLHKRGGVNFIELTEGYLEKASRFVSVKENLSKRGG